MNHQTNLQIVKFQTCGLYFSDSLPHFYKKAVKPIRYQSCSGFSHLTRCCYSLGCMLRYVMAHKKATTSGKEDVGKHMMG